MRFISDLVVVAPVPFTTYMKLKLLALEVYGHPLPHSESDVV